MITLSDLVEGHFSYWKPLQGQHLK